MRLAILQLFISLLSSLALAAPRPNALDRRAPLINFPPSQLPDPDTVAKIAASYRAHLAQTRLSFVSKLIRGKTKGAAEGMNCFCAGGSVCCSPHLGQLDCNMGNCGI